MFRTPNQTGNHDAASRTLRAQQDHLPAWSSSLQPSAIQPRNSNRKPKLLETPQLQQNKPGSGLSIVSAIAEQLIQPGDTNSPALIAKKPIFPPSISTHLPQPTRAPQRGQHRPANRARIRQTRTKSESDPSFMFRLNGGPIVYFQELTTNFNRTMFRLKRFCSTATPGCVGFRQMARCSAEEGTCFVPLVYPESYRRASLFTLSSAKGRLLRPRSRHMRSRVRTNSYLHRRCTLGGLRNLSYKDQKSNAGVPRIAGFRRRRTQPFAELFHAVGHSEVSNEFHALVPKLARDAHAQRPPLPTGRSSPFIP